MFIVDETQAWHKIENQEYQDPFEPGNTVENLCAVEWVKEDIHYEKEVSYYNFRNSESTTVKQHAQKIPCRTFWNFVTTRPNVLGT